MKMDTPSENSISWGGIIFVALARNVLVLRFRSAMEGEFVVYCYTHQMMMERERVLVGSLYVLDCLDNTRVWDCHVPRFQNSQISKRRC